MNIGNMSESEKTYSLIKKSLDASVNRGQVIANNIANVNTKGYKRHYVTFEESLEQSKKNLGLDITNKNHITHSEKYGEIDIKRDESTGMRMDGNNVDIDNEMTNLAANTLKYNALITELNSRLSLKRYIVNGGK
ncbi:flagellar basal body rod protein FlgB [Clostridium bovifaecis]|uniref:Flagellar basal body rod protein FlgB n=1 Tax=Clostridium bovifaecis TaxID=2184719 RepID=A0A6I6ES70_9CLOT|nr:flagellar basal body rod protein FlgB [Clostridium bovifaecis]